MATEIREDYLEALAELTVASRPIIKTLTEIAQENVDYAAAIVEAVDQHTMTCPDNQKLPALYLIDSICKNCGEPYPSLFARNIVKLFTNAFALSSENTRIKMDEQFKTWTVVNQNTNQPLFSHTILREINSYMVNVRMSANSTVPTTAVPQTMPGIMPRLNQSALMVEMNRYRTILEQDPRDQFIETQLQLLARYEAQVGVVIDPKLLPQIQAEVENMRSARETHLNTTGKRRFDRRDNRRNHNANGNGREQHSNRSKSRGGVDKSSGTNNIPLGTRSRVPTPSSNELEAIKKSIEVPITEVPITDNDQSPEPTDPEDLQQLLENNPIDSSSIRIQPRGKSFDIDSVDILIAGEVDASFDLISQLYSVGLPLQCSTCGYRFKDTQEGHDAKQAEMDWHFRANKDIREGHSRSRSWFLGAHKWEHYKDEDEVFGSGSEIASSNVMQGSTSTQTETVDLEKEREKYTEVPLDSNAVCPVCQEPHETSWSEEAENWVWMNTVEVNGYYFHATCYADPQNQALVASVLGP